MTQDPIQKLRDEYTMTLERHEQAIASLKQKTSRISWMRLTVFVFGLVSTYFLLRLGFVAGIAFLVLVIGVFLYLVRRHARLIEQTTHMERLASVNRAELAALDGDFDGFGDGAAYDVPGHPYAHDLDIFGEESLFRILNRTVTLGGSAKLAEWMKNPELSARGILARQEAVKEMEPDTGWNQEFLAIGMAAAEDAEDRKVIDGWLNEEPLFFSRSWVPLALLLLPIAMLAFVAIAVLGYINVVQLVFLLFIPLGISGIFLKRVNALHARLGRKAGLLLKYARLFGMIERRSFRSDFLLEQQTEAGGAGKALSKLAGILDALDSRLNPFAGILLNIFLLWDIRQIYRLEKWKSSFAEQTGAWFSAVFHVDALLSMAVFAHNHPEGVFPVPDEEGPLLLCSEAGHPIIPFAKRVNNPVSVEDWGQFMIITGANMAGKSTYLRTIGVNLVLAMSGCPVIAGDFRFRPAPMIASIRTRDSLKSNESYFYAELKKLKRIIEVLSERPHFVILDEILKGTNSLDKQSGSRALVGQLVSLGASGMIATHDLSLGELEQTLPGSIRNHCFEVQIQGDRLYFDYLLHEGIAQNLNASFLMRKMGITI